jgi:hypothetical protein
MGRGLTSGPVWRERPPDLQTQDLHQARGVLLSRLARVQTRRKGEAHRLPAIRNFQSVVAAHCRQSSSGGGRRSERENNYLEIPESWQAGARPLSLETIAPQNGVKRLTKRWVFLPAVAGQVQCTLLRFKTSRPSSSPLSRSAMSHKGSVLKSCQPLLPSRALVIVEGFTPHASAS